MAQQTPPSTWGAGHCRGSGARRPAARSPGSPPFERVVDHADHAGRTLVLRPGEPEPGRQARRGRAPEHRRVAGVGHRLGERPDRHHRLAPEGLGDLDDGVGERPPPHVGLDAAQARRDRAAPTARTATNSFSGQWIVRDRRPRRARPSGDAGRSRRTGRGRCGRPSRSAGPCDNHSTALARHRRCVEQPGEREHQDRPVQDRRRLGLPDELGHADQSADDVIDAGGSAPRRRTGAPPGTCRCAAGCGRACGTSRCRRCRWPAAPAFTSLASTRRRGRWCRRPPNASPDR